jgi:hypothetical protein
MSYKKRIYREEKKLLCHSIDSETRAVLLSNAIHVILQTTIELLGCLGTRERSSRELSPKVGCTAGGQDGDAR